MKLKVFLILLINVIFSYPKAPEYTENKNQKNKHSEQKKSISETILILGLKEKIESNPCFILYCAIQIIRKKKAGVKEATIMVYIAADNDLHYFAWKNIRQLAQVAPENLNIIVQINEPGKYKKTQRYLITKDKAYELNKQNKDKLDSGSSETLVDFCGYCINTFPANDYVLILWNHGTGIIDPQRRLRHFEECLHFNPANLTIEVDRNFRDLEEMDLIEREETKGICFDDQYNSYLTNQKLEKALNTITNKYLGGKKLALIGMDACLMSMLEVANIFKKYAHIMVSSQEVELGAGWQYDKVLKYYNSRNLNGFAKHIVEAYKQAYESIYPDYTLSAVNLDLIEELEKSINNLAKDLIDASKNQIGMSVKNLIKKCKEKIGFDIPSYIDLCTFCESLSKNIDSCTLKSNEAAIKESIKKHCTDCINAANKSIIANASGKNVPFAKGISIYLPEREKLHSSYARTNFAASNNWFNLISSYL